MRKTTCFAVISLFTSLSGLSALQNPSAAPTPQASAPALPEACVAFHYMATKVPQSLKDMTKDQTEAFIKWFETTEFEKTGNECFSSLEQQVRGNKDLRVQVRIQQEEVWTLLKEGLADQIALAVYWSELHKAGLR